MIRCDQNNLYVRRLPIFFQESGSVELKEIVVDDIKKEIIAFANCGGGLLYIGVNDSGEVTGVDNIDKTMLQISNMVRDTPLGRKGIDREVFN